MKDKIMKKFPWCTVDAGLLVLRIGVGAIFITTGWMKVSDLDMTVGFFGQMGFSPFWAYLVTAVELLGGITVLLGVGIYTRIAAKLLAIVMIVATYTMVSQQTGPLIMALATVALAPFSLIFSTIALAIAGGGKHSLMRE